VIPATALDVGVVVALDTVVDERTDLVEEEEFGGVDVAEVLLLITGMLVNELVGALVVLEEV
jgi:hypothetical protein